MPTGSCYEKKFSFCNAKYGGSDGSKDGEQDEGAANTGLAVWKNPLSKLLGIWKIRSGYRAIYKKRKRIHLCIYTNVLIIKP